jgi:hypothetical protein
MQLDHTAHLRCIKLASRHYVRAGDAAGVFAVDTAAQHATKHDPDAIGVVWQMLIGAAPHDSAQRNPALSAELPDYSLSKSAHKLSTAPGCAQEGQACRCQFGTEAAGKQLPDASHAPCNAGTSMVHL